MVICKGLLQYVYDVIRKTRKMVPSAVSSIANYQRPRKPLLIRRCLRALSELSVSSDSATTANKSNVFNRRQFPFGLRDNKDAKLAAERMNKAERKLLFEALRKSMADQYNEHKRLGNAVIHSDDLICLWYVYFVPHLAVGVMHSAIFIFAGEHLQTFGAHYGLTIMGAAGLGNVISNVLMLNFNKQVETSLEKIGIKRPILSAEQLHNPEVRYLSFMGKLLGMLIGSILGLFPLLIYEHPVDRREKISKRTRFHSTYARSFQEETTFQYARAEEDQELLEQKTETMQLKKATESSPEELHVVSPES